NLFLQSYWLVAHFLIPAAPAVLLAHKLYDQVTGVIGHSGWEHGGAWCRPPSPLVSVTHHDQHHRYFRCNYATHFTLWDRLMGTLHPEHDAEARRNIAATAAVRRAARVPAE
ncbi:MAG: sterol desaturase family protein, partial [Alphaproteobacteria bacterium]